MLDIYRPEDSQEKILPVIINVHSRGLIIGNKEFNRYFCVLLQEGISCIQHRVQADSRLFPI